MRANAGNTERMMSMNKSKAKAELSKIAKSYSIPPYGKQALFDGLREVIKKIEEEHGECTYEVKCSAKAGELPVIRISPRAAKRG